MGQNNEFGRLTVVVCMYVVVVVVIPYILQLSVTLIFDIYENRAYWPLIDDEKWHFPICYHLSNYSSSRITVI